MYKIMFVDDEEQNLFLMEKIIDWEENGFRVCGLALDGPEGIQVFKETEPDVVFVDIRMDEMDGLEMIEKLRQEKKKAVYVIVTAYDEFSYAKKAISLGVKDYLLKPVSRKELLSMVQEIKEELDSKREKEDESRFINRQYERGMFAKAFSTIETCCLERQSISDLPEFEHVIRGRTLRSFEMFSPTEELADLLLRTESWEVEYRFPGYDGIYFITPEEKTTAILKEFENLKKHNLKKKYFLQVNRKFSDVQSFVNGYCEDFKNRSTCFYEKQSRAFFSDEGSGMYGRSYLSYREDSDKLLRRLIYNGVSEETESLVWRMAQYAREQGSSPDGLIDEMIELLFLIKSELTRLYKDRAFFILRHQNVWDMHRIRTEAKLISRMVELLRETADAVNNIVENKGNYSLKGRTAEYIGEHFADPEFSAGEVAEAVHLSRNYFLKVFKEEMGVAFMDYVTNIRMEKAKQLLKDTEETVYAISRAVGYESQYHFSRKFKNLNGISPNEYRSL